MALQYLTILPLDKKTFYREKEVAANKNKVWKVKILSLNEQLNTVKLPGKLRLWAVSLTRARKQENLMTESVGECFQA